MFGSFENTSTLTRQSGSVIDEIEIEVLRYWEETGRSPEAVYLGRNEKDRLDAGFKTLVADSKNFKGVTSLKLDNGGSLAVIAVDEYSYLEAGRKLDRFRTYVNGLWKSVELLPLTASN